MKRLIAIIILVVLIIGGGFVVIRAKSLYDEHVPSELQLNSAAAALYNMDDDEFIYKKNIEDPYAVASISKLMTIYIVLEQLRNGHIHWDDSIVISESANNLIDRAAKITIRSGEKMSLRDAFYATVMASTNNTANALAEYIAGTQDEFVKLMNDKARLFGLSFSTKFHTPSGLPLNNEENMMTAHDIVLMANRLLSDFGDEMLEMTRTKYYTLSPSGYVLTSTNKMLYEDEPVYDNTMDGLKTGYTDMAGFCFVGTSVKDGKRYITVIIRAKDEIERFVETKKMLEHNYTWPEWGNIFKEALAFE